MSSCSGTQTSWVDTEEVRTINVSDTMGDVVDLNKSPLILLSSRVVRPRAESLSSYDDIPCNLETMDVARL